MEYSYLKKLLLLAIAWNSFVYLSMELVYVIYIMQPIQLFLGVLCSALIAKNNQARLLTLSTVIIPINSIAPFLPDTSNGLVLVYSWYSSIAFEIGIVIWAIFVKIKSLTSHSSRTTKKRVAP